MKKTLIFLIIGIISATTMNADGWNDMRNGKSIIKEKLDNNTNQDENNDRFKKEDNNTTKPEKKKERKPLW